MGDLGVSPLGKPSDDGRIVPAARTYRGSHGSLGKLQLWNCPACHVENTGPLEHGCQSCGAGDQRQGRGGGSTPAVAPDPPPPPQMGGFDSRRAGPAPENPTGGGERRVAPSPDASTIRVIRIIEYVFKSPDALRAVLQRSLVGTIHLGGVQMTGAIVDHVSERQEEILRLAKLQPGVWLGKPTHLETRARVEGGEMVFGKPELPSVPPAKPEQGAAAPPPPPSPPDQGVTPSAEMSALATELIRIGGTRLGQTLAVALQSMASELEGVMSEDYLSPRECLELAQALTLILPEVGLVGEVQEP